MVRWPSPLKLNGNISGFKPGNSDVAIAVYEFDDLVARHPG
jgi:hypothetical protein